MKLPFLHQETKTIATAAFIVGFFSFVSRFIGLVRDRVLAGAFGAGDTLDIYYTAFKFPDLLMNLFILGALSASFIPLFTKHISDGKITNNAWKFTNAVLHFLVIGYVFFACILFIFAHPLSQLLAPGFALWKQEQVALFIRILLLAQLLLGISMVFGSVLQAIKRFHLYALAPIFYNIGIILGAIFFTSFFGSIGLVFGVTFGALLHLILQYYGVMRAGYRYKPVWHWDVDIQRFFRLMGPRVLSIGLSQVNMIIMTFIASFLPIGSVTILTFAFNIQFFPLGIVAISYAVAAFPAFCQSVQKQDLPQVGSIFSHTLRQMLFFLMPATIIFLLLRAQIVRVVVGAGLFDWQATILTADTLAFFTLSFFAQAIIFIQHRLYFALQDTVTPFVIGIVSTVVNILSSFYFIDQIGVIGFGAAYSLSSILQMILLWNPLRTRIGSLGGFALLRSLFIMTSAGLACAVVIQFLKPVATHIFSLQTFFGVLFQGIFSGGIGIIVYVFVSWILKSPELNESLSVLHRRFFRKVKPTEVITPME